MYDQVKTLKLLANVCIHHLRHMIATSAENYRFAVFYYLLVSSLVPLCTEGSR